MSFALPVALPAQFTEVTLMAGRSTADAAWYSSSSGTTISTHGDRNALTTGVGLRWKRWERFPLSAGLSFVPRGYIAGSEWMNASYLDLSASGALLLRDRTRIFRPYVSFGVSGGALIRCRRGDVNPAGPWRDSCGNGVTYYPAVRPWHSSGDIAFGVRVRTPPRHFDVEWAYSRSLATFEGEPHYGNGSFHRVMALRVRACIAKCR